MSTRNAALLAVAAVALLAGGCATVDEGNEPRAGGMTMPTGPVVPPIAADLGYDAAATPGAPIALPYFMHPQGCRCGMPWDRPNFTAKGLFNDTDPALPPPPY